MGLRTSILVGVLACGAAVPGLAQAPEPAFRRVRAIDAVMLERVHRGFRRSATFRQVVLALEQSDVIVYLTPGLCELGRIAGCLQRFVKASENDRYLRIVINGALS